MPTRWHPLSFILFLLIIRCAQAQTTSVALDAPSTNETSERPNAAEEERWEFSLSAYTYLIPDGKDYVQPTITADRDWLHIEARYNYEGLDTGSAWLGYNFSFGDKITLDFTPMVGGIVGDTNGVAPGYKATLTWWQLELYTEGEYVFDVGDSSNNFFYTWSELSLHPLDWLRVGLVIQRTRDYETDFDIQHGLLIGFTYKNLNFTTYVLNAEDNPILVLAIGFSF